MEVAAAAPPRREGYWFAPTDVELIDYLNKKAANKPILVAIHDVDITRETPITLSETYPKLGANEWYFFAEFDRKYPNGKRPDRRCGPNGVLKASQGDKKIYSAGGQLIGFQKKLIFCEERGRQKPRKLENTDWKIDEYRLNRSGIRPDDDGKLDWVLLRIYQRSYRKRNRQDFDPPVPENNAASTENARNREAVDQINVDGDHPGVPTENNGGSTTEYNALMHDMDAPAAEYKIPKLVHYDSDVDFSSGGNGTVPVNTVIYNPTNYGGGGFAMVPVVPDDAYYYDAPPPQLFDFNYPSPTDDARNRQSMDDPCVPVVYTGTTGNTFDQIPQENNFSNFSGNDYSTPSPTDDARNRETLDDPGVFAANSSTTEYNTFHMPQQINFPGSDYPAIDFSTPFATNTTSDINPRHGGEIEIVDDLGVPVNTGTTDNTFDHMPQQINFNFPVIDYSTPSPTDDAINRQIMDNPGVHAVNISTTEYNTFDDQMSQPIHDFGDFDSPNINFTIDVQDIDFLGFSIPSPPDDAIKNRQAMDDPGVPVTTTSDNAFQMPQQTYLGFPATDFNTPFPTNTATDNPRNRQAMDDPGVPAVYSSTTEYNALHNGVPAAFDFSAVNSGIPFPMNTIREATEIVDDPASTSNAIEMPAQINFEDFDFTEINFSTDFQDIDLSADDFGIPLPADHIEH